MNSAKSIVSEDHSFVAVIHEIGARASTHSASCRHVSRVRYCNQLIVVQRFTFDSMCRALDSQLGYARIEGKRARPWARIRRIISPGTIRAGGSRETIGRFPRQRRAKTSISEAELAGGPNFIHRVQKTARHV